MIGTIECPDCGRDCEVKETKKGKPYFSCEECGTQHFYRTPEGIRRLKARMKAGGPAPAADAETPAAAPEPKAKPDEPKVERKQGGESIGWGLF